ncbi:MAG: LysR family transcriptional regulator [Beijerinckiaceae bacterium]
MLHSAALQYFREVARQGSIRRAAATLNIAASAINRHILNLEADMGTPLFDRVKGGMRLTVAGDLLLRHIINTLHDFDRVRADMDKLRSARTGHIRLVAVDSLLVDFLPRAIERFVIDFPAVNFTVHAAQPTDVTSSLLEGNADLGFTFVGQLPAHLRYLADTSAPIGAVMRSDHPLAGQSVIDLAAVQAYPVLSQSGPLPRGADSDASFTRFKESLSPRLQSNSIQMIKLAVMLNMGIAFFTRLGFLKEIADGEIVWRPLNSRGVGALRIGLIASSTRELSEPAQHFSRQLIGDIKRYLGPSD